VLTTADGQRESLVITMTGQIANQFKYEGEIYQLVAYTGEDLYTAEDFGITSLPIGFMINIGYSFKPV